MLYKYDYASPLGRILLLAKDEYLIGCYFESGKYYPHLLVKEAVYEKTSVIKETCDYLDSYFSCLVPTGYPMMNLEGTSFQKEVWKLLLEIPYGKTVTYGDLAKKMALERNKVKMSSQAIGQAVSKNPISIIVPCHRVVGTDGSLVGYAGGIEKKKSLLELEMHGKIDKETVD